MALATDITLPKHVTPVFPDLCIVCHSRPDSTTKITKNSQHWLATFFAPILSVFGWSRTEIPICRWCKPRFYFQRWGRTLLCMAILMAAITIAWPYFDNWGRLTKKIAIAGFALIAMAPYVAFEILWPRSFNIAAEGSNVTYEFASKSYAIQFYQLNREHILKSDIEVLHSFRK
jgi:hypothetical protein